MKLAVLGATRGTGRKVVDEALARGHEVTALARDPSALPSSPKLTVVKGDARQAADVEKAIAGCDAVISCLGTHSFDPPQFLVSTGAEATVEAMKRAGVKRLLLLSVQGASESAKGMGAMLGAMRLLAKKLYLTIFDDKNRAEALIRATDLEWTFVRGPRLTDGPRTGRYRAAEGFHSPLSKISRADTAVFMVDEVEQPKWVRRGPCVRW